MEDAAPDIPQWIPGLLRLLESSEAASSSQHPGDACVHFRFVEKDTLIRLLDSLADSFAEAFIVFNQQKRGLLHQERRSDPFHTGLPVRV
jgi:hypothetical protein